MDKNTYKSDLFEKAYALSNPHEVAILATKFAQCIPDHKNIDVILAIALVLADTIKPNEEEALYVFNEALLRAVDAVRTENEPL